VYLPIETERLRLRRYEDRDLGDILAFTRDADFWLARNTRWPATEDGVREYWEAQRDVDPGKDPKWFDLVIELRTEQRAIGSAGSAS
jgi:RimJ/RimL family protein N-acetyltransferase